jgi:two-component system sensor histidine kinase/response regulator
MMLYLERIELAPLLDNISMMMAGMADKKNVTLHFEFTPEMAFIEVDPGRFKQILINLISNAIKFNKPDGYVFVRLKQSDDLQWFTVEVEDTGIGIPPHQLSWLFTKFAQADAATSRNYEGAGLGLALTKELVELHGGVISVVSKPELGTTFTVKMPHPAATSGSLPAGKVKMLT